MHGQALLEGACKHSNGPGSKCSRQQAGGPGHEERESRCPHAVCNRLHCVGSTPKYLCLGTHPEPRNAAANTVTFNSLPWLQPVLLTATQHVC
jgi:hypothetical protein